MFLVKNTISSSIFKWMIILWESAFTMKIILLVIQIFDITNKCWLEYFTLTKASISSLTLITTRIQLFAIQFIKLKLTVKYRIGEKATLYYSQPSNWLHLFKNPLVFVTISHTYNKSSQDWHFLSVTQQGTKGTGGKRQLQHDVSNVNLIL